MRSANAVSVLVLRQSQPAECELLWRLRREAWLKRRAGCPTRRITRHRTEASRLIRRASAAYSDVLRSGRLDGPLAAARSGGPAGWDRRLPQLFGEVMRRFGGFVAKYM